MVAKYPAAMGLRRAKDRNAGGFLWHSPDGGRLYVIRDSPNYYLCASCDAAGRNAVVRNSESTWTPDNKSPGPLGSKRTFKIDIRVWGADHPGNVANQTVTLELTDRGGEVDVLDEVVTAINELVKEA